MDGEYNKYPKYHGCLRFDDDNIYTVKNGLASFNGSPALGIGNAVVKLSGSDNAARLNRKVIAGYFNTDFGPGTKANDACLIIPPDGLVYAFKTLRNVYTVGFMGYSSSQVTIYLGEKPVEDAITVNSGYLPTDVIINCNFDGPYVIPGLENATYNYNVPFPDISEVLA